MKKTLITTLLTTVLATAFAAEALAQESIHFGMEPTYPPFEYMNEQHELTGFDVELARAICTELKAACKFSNQPFDSLIPGLRFRRFDAIISGMDITPKRRRQVAFSDPYYANSAVFVAATKSKFTKVEDFIGKTVGVQNGSTHQAYLIHNLEKKGVQTRSYDNYQNALLDMMNGRVDAVFADTAVAREWLVKQAPGVYQEVGEKIKDPEYFGIGMGIATRKGDPLGEKLNKALAAVRTNGTYKKLYAKYFHSGQ